MDSRVYNFDSGLQLIWTAKKIQYNFVTGKLHIFLCVKI